MRMWVWSLASLSGLRIQCYHELWCQLQMWLGSHIAVAVYRPAASAPIQSLPWELPYATGTALIKAKKAKNKETKSVWTGCLHLTWAHSHLWKHNFCKTLTTRGIRHSSINQWVVTSPLTRNPEPPLDKPYPPWKQRIETRGITILQPVEGTQEQKIRRKMRRQKNVLDKETR